MKHKCWNCGADKELLSGLCVKCGRFHVEVKVPVINEYRLTRPALWVSGKPGEEVEVASRLPYYVRAEDAFDAAAKLGKKFPKEIFEVSLFRENVGEFNFAVAGDK